MRHRSTWNQDRQAATSRTADIYEMNQEHPQPSPTEYENGDPNSWAETPTKNEYVTQSYDGDHEARNEVGFAEFAPSTFDHKDSKEWGGSGKYDNQRGGMTASSQKAMAAERVARAVLRTANDELVQQQSVDFMSLPDVVLASTLKRLDSVSPNALPKEIKLRRCYACVKLASNMIPAKTRFASEEVYNEHVEKLGRALASLDDPTLRSLIKLSLDANKAAVKVAKDEEEKDDKDKAAATSPVAAPKEEKKDDEKDKAAAVAPVAAPVVEEDDAGETACDMETSCMSEDDMNMLNTMMGDPTAPAPGIPGQLPVAPAPLTDLFGAPAPAAVPQVPAMASEFDISFGDDDEQPAHLASDSGDELSSLFNDHEEVRAQHEILAAHNEQQARELGHQPVSSTRTASTASPGVKKLGAVRKDSATPKNELDSLWA